MNNDKLLDIRKLSVHYHNNGNITKAVENIDLSIQRAKRSAWSGSPVAENPRLRWRYSAL